MITLADIDAALATHAANNRPRWPRIRIVDSPNQPEVTSNLPEISQLQTFLDNTRSADAGDRGDGQSILRLRTPNGGVDRITAGGKDQVVYLAGIAVDNSRLAYICLRKAGLTHGEARDRILETLDGLASFDFEKLDFA